MMTKNSWQGTIFDKKVTERFKKLGELGEYLAEDLLASAGFMQIENLNQKRNNTKHFDLIATEDNQTYAISVKARNKFENSVAGIKVNARYKLTSDLELFEAEARKKYQAIPAWIAISLDFDLGVFDAYFGVISELSGNKKGISMTPQATAKYRHLAMSLKLNDMGISDNEMQGLRNIYKRI